MLSVEQLPRQKIILLISFGFYLIFLLFSSPITKSLNKFESLASWGLILISAWIVFYGLRFIWASIKFKTWNIPSIILIFIWILAIIPFFYAVFKELI